MTTCILRFDRDEAKAVVEALKFTQERIIKYYGSLYPLVDKSHHALVQKETDQYVEKINKAINKIDGTIEAPSFIGRNEYDDLMDLSRSALEIYLQNTLDAKKRTGLQALDDKIQEIQNLISLESLKDRKFDLFSKFLENPKDHPQAEKVEVFFSYSTLDKTLVGEIASRLRGQVDVFLAHESIEISAEWREEILKHLDSCKVMIAVVTHNFENSVWTNQEFGYLLAKGRRIIPLIFEDSDIRKCGFLEAIQGFKTKPEEIENVAKKLVQLIFERK